MSDSGNLSVLMGELGLSAPEVERVGQFYSLLKAENQIQNLTRLIEPADFVEGHLIDVLELKKSGFLDFPAMDLGSGAGVPGLLFALLYGGSWILSDSEKMKALWLETAAQKLGLNDVLAVGERAEKILSQKRVSTVVARAVGPVERIYAWLDPCSTWNNLVLLKGPGWDQEWADFQQSRWRNRLKIEATTQYTVGPEQKKRVIVKLRRVPRGTKADG